MVFMSGTRSAIFDSEQKKKIVAAFVRRKHFNVEKVSPSTFFFFRNEEPFSSIGDGLEQLCGSLAKGSGVRVAWGERS